MSLYSGKKWSVRLQILLSDHTARSNGYVQTILSDRSKTIRAATHCPTDYAQNCAKLPWQTHPRSLAEDSCATCTSPFLELPSATSGLSRFTCLLSLNTSSAIFRGPSHAGGRDVSFELIGVSFQFAAILKEGPTRPKTQLRNGSENDS